MMPRSEVTRNLHNEIAFRGEGEFPLRFVSKQQLVGSVEEWDFAFRAVPKLINPYIGGTLCSLCQKGSSVLKNSFVPFSDSRSGA
jgi:hypothetical protein